MAGEGQRVHARGEFVLAVSAASAVGPIGVEMLTPSIVQFPETGLVEAKFEAGLQISRVIVLAINQSH